jgi:hypothetical protein
MSCKEESRRSICCSYIDHKSYLRSDCGSLFNFPPCLLISVLIYDVAELCLIYRFNIKKQRCLILMLFFGVDPGVKCVKFNELKTSLEVL